MSAPASRPPFPTRFVIVTFVAAAIVGAAVLYFGLNGTLAGGIP